MPSQNDEMIYNWSNSLRQNNDGERFIAAQTAANLKDRGFTASEAIDVMAADNFEINIAENAISETYSTPTASKSIPKRTAMVVPTNYADILPIVEDALASLPARDFVDKLSSGTAPILRVSQRNLQSWHRLAGMAKTDDNALSQLHRELRPWVEEAMLNSVLLAEKFAETVKIVRQASNTYSTSTPKGNFTLDMDKATCNCTRYAGGNYATFGLACEHLVAVADAVSPHTRLKRAMQTQEDNEKTAEEDNESAVKSKSKSKSPNPCWSGYHKVPGAKDYDSGSCEKNS